MVDTDRRTISERGAVLKERTQGDFSLAASNPCFELWTSLQFRNALFLRRRAGTAILVFALPWFRLGSEAEA